RHRPADVAREQHGYLCLERHVYRNGYDHQYRYHLVAARCALGDGELDCDGRRGCAGGQYPDTVRVDVDPARIDARWSCGAVASASTLDPNHDNTATCNWGPSAY